MEKNYFPHDRGKSISIRSDVNSVILEFLSSYVADEEQELTIRVIKNVI